MRNASLGCSAPLYSHRQQLYLRGLNTFLMNMPYDTTNTDWASAMYKMLSQALGIPQWLKKKKGYDPHLHGVFILAKWRRETNREQNPNVWVGEQESKVMRKWDLSNERIAVGNKAGREPSLLAFLIRWEWEDSFHITEARIYLTEQRASAHTQGQRPTRYIWGQRRSGRTGVAGWGYSGRSEAGDWGWEADLLDPR